MKTHFKISLVVVALATLLAIITAAQTGAGAIVITFGATCCLAGLFSLVISAIFALSKQKEVARAFLISAGITFLLGTGVCSTLLI
ncbi:MAG: hypothetical protein J0H74_02710 [Chitinophagaceae bacterium]|nr:hypothetical protein [Chitinophagaceae bacterium]